MFPQFLPIIFTMYNTEFLNGVSTTGYSITLCDVMIFKSSVILLNRLAICTDFTWQHSYCGLPVLVCAPINSSQPSLSHRTTWCWIFPKLF